MKNIKINFKWWLFYVLLIFLASFLIKNFNFFSNYLKNPYFYYQVDKLKLAPKLTFLNIPVFPGLDYKDESNLFLLNKNFAFAKQTILNQNKLNYQDFFNLGNIALLQGISLIKKLTGDYVSYFQQAKANYTVSYDIVPSYVFKKPLIYNSYLATKLLQYSYVIYCDNLFLKFIFLTNKLISQLEQIKNALIKQDKALKKWYYYKDLKKCIDSLRADSARNIQLIYTNLDFFQKVKRGLIYKMINYVDQEDLCYQNSNYLKSKYQSSLKNSLQYFVKFYKLQNDLLLVYQKANYLQMKLLCSNKSKLAKKLSKNNQQMQKNYNNLSDLANQPKPSRKKSHPNSQPKKPNEKRASSGKPNLKDFNKKLIEKLKKQNEIYMKKMIQERSVEKFNPYKQYIKPLFKEFYGNDSYYKVEKNQSVGK